jgi:4-amino-4-deoxy-L-arabinose transferase-like glycosyltransferase
MRVLASCSSVALFLLLSHLPFISAPYFWDEAGQFIPASLDLYYSGEIVPTSTIPNVHPPGVMMYLAATWHLFGYSIITTRIAMLLVAMLGCWWVYRLAADFLCPDRKAAVMTLVLLCLSPLFFSQSIMTLLDMPAMALTTLALWLFLGERPALASLACVALVMVKETGALLPAVLGIVLVYEHRWKQSVYFLIPAFPLAGWLLLLHARTGHWFGNASFTQYNLLYPLNPVRFALASFRRGYYLFIGSGYFIGTAALSRTHGPVVNSSAWRVAAIFATAHVIAMSLVGGAVLERYLLPVLPILLAAFANALCSLTSRYRSAAFAVMCTASAACILVNPIYPFPLENNLAWTDFVAVQHDAAVYLSTHLQADATVSSTFPFAGCLRRPELGYTARTFHIEELPDFTRASLESLRGHQSYSLAIFSSTWDPLGLMRHARWVAFLEQFYGFEPDVAPDEIPAMLGLHSVARFEQHGQWIEIFQP